MDCKFAATVILLGALLIPGFSYAADMSTDTTGEYLDDAAITAKNKGDFCRGQMGQGARHQRSHRSRRCGFDRRRQQQEGV